MELQNAGEIIPGMMSNLPYVTSFPITETCANFVATNVTFM